MYASFSELNVPTNFVLLQVLMAAKYQLLETLNTVLLSICCFFYLASLWRPGPLYIVFYVGHYHKCVNVVYLYAPHFLQS